MAGTGREHGVLIDAYLPRYDVSEHHEVRVSAAPGRTYAAVWDADLAAAFPVKALLALRALPGLFAAPRTGPRLAARLTLRDVLRLGFFVLDEDPGREIVVGVVGRFWKPTGNLLPGDRARFLAPPEPGTACAAWNFTVSELPDGGTLLSTETRVRCADQASRRRFRRYWLVVGPFSGLIRRFMLASIRRAAEAG